MGVVRVFNPIYDTVFKYLMEDKKVAKVLLGSILSKTIVNIVPKKHEHVLTDDKSNLQLMRIDFAATIEIEGGKKEVVTIELQKAAEEEEVMRFRKYLGEQYQSDDNADRVVRQRKVKTEKGLVVEDREVLKARHIYTIYILGHTIGEGYKRSVIWGETKFRDTENTNLGEGKDNEFLNGLTHDTCVIQIPLLPERPRKPVEKLLSIFDQRYRASDNARYVEIKEDYAEEPEYKLLVDRLLRGVADEQLRGDLNFEDEMVRKFRRDWLDKMDMEVTIGEQKEELAKKDEVIMKKDEVIAKKDEVIAESKEMLAKKDEMLVKKDDVIASSVMAFAELGMTEEQIAERTKLGVEEVRKYLK